MTLQTVLHYLPFVVAPFVLFLFSLVSAYVLKFGLPKTGINFDYILFTFFVVIACLLGGVF